MTGQFLLDSAVLAVSFFNMILLLWLGLMVLLNAERRAWGIWVAAVGLLAGAAFLVIHTALYAGAWVRVSLGLNLAWYVGWVLALALPLTWYLNMLWYAGYWEDSAGPLHRSQRPWLRLMAVAGLGLLALLVFANPLPSYSRIVDYETAGASLLGSVPLAILAFPLYILLCISLSLYVLLRPAPSGRVMGDLARRRARPWLLATSLALLAVSGLVAWVVTWLFLQLRYGTASERLARMAVPVAWFDLAIDSVLAGGILLLGQAMVAYEIFTGSALPRRGLRRHWLGVVLLAAGLSVLAATTLTGGIRPVNGLLMAAGLVALAFALLNRQSFAERERYIEHLRPFVASLRLYEHLLGHAASGPPEAGVVTAFEALCDDVLGARVAYLAALGRLAPLVGAPLSYPAGRAAPLSALPKLRPQLEAVGLCAPVDPAACASATWAVPLRSEGQLVGVLLLGEKRDGGLYAQEEIEVARASGERLIDTAASAELARRLMALQRQRLAEGQVLDQQARRTLHDQVLPRLHAAILSLAASGSEAGDAAETLAEAHRSISDLLRAMPSRVDPELGRLGLAGALRHAVEREAAGEFLQVTWAVEPEAEARARAIPPRFAEVLYYAAREAIRNAARYGRGDDPARPLSLQLALCWQGGLQLVIEDNGVGMSGAEPAPAGAGQGLALHSTLMAVIGGALAVDSVPGEYTRVTLSLPQEVC